MRNAMDFVDPKTTPFVPTKSRGELPHLYKPAGTYFVSCRLLEGVLLRKNAKLSAANESKKWEFSTPNQIARAHEPPLTLGSCVLQRADIAMIVQNALLHFHRQRYLLIAWCIMPNHVHVIFAPHSGNLPNSILHGWKSFTAHEINRVLGTTGPVWERESFDHLVRNIESLEGFVRYTEENPVQARLCARIEDWPYSTAGVRFDCGAGVSPAHLEDAGETPAPQR